jgi:hypothetical protein
MPPNRRPPDRGPDIDRRGHALIAAVMTARMEVMFVDEIPEIINIKPETPPPHRLRQRPD